jgi:hypothetical protein
MTAQEPHQPVFVTFASGADLLIRLGIDPEATAAGLRYTARVAPDWPFGEDRAHPYVMVANARTMETGIFLEYFRKHPRTGRGRDRTQRRKRGESR